MRTLLPLLLAAPAVAADVIDSPMYLDPDVVRPKVVRTFPDGLADRWRTALDRPEADLQAQTAGAIALAHERGMSGLSIAIGPLTRLLDSPSAAVRAAAVRALVALEARETSSKLLELANNEPDLRDAIEPVLARWDHHPAAAVWLKRLSEPPPFHRSHVLAMQGLAVLKDESAADPLRAIVLSDQYAGSHRLEAARALGKLRVAGSEADADTLSADASPRGIPARLAAAALLRQHSGDGAVKRLDALARDPEPAVAAIALARLVEIDPKLVLPLLRSVFASPAADVRIHGVEALCQLPSVEHARQLGPRLADPHPDVRDRARRGLRAFADQVALRPTVIEEGVKALAAADWRGQEQAALILGQLGHTAVSGRLVELLRSDRPEPAIASAWALRVLAVPDTLPAALEHIQLRHGQLLANGVTAGLRGYSPDQMDRHLTQLVQFIGTAKYRPADAELRKLFPRFLQAGMPPVFSPVGPETRAAAVWALGRVHAAAPPGELLPLIEERLTGDGQLGQDDPRVRRMAVVSLTRMKSQGSLEAIKIEAGDRPTLNPVALISRWAVSQMTGQPLAPPGVYELPQRDWFLIPVGGK